MSSHQRKNKRRMSSNKESDQGSSSSGGSNYTRGGSGGGGRRPKAFPLGNQTSVHNLSDESWATLMRVNKKRRRMNNTYNSGTTSALFDNSSPKYSWLIPGWLVEERLMPSGRVYRYYYDPIGQMYNNRQAVVSAYESCGLIVLDL